MVLRWSDLGTSGGARTRIHHSRAFRNALRACKNALRKPRRPIHRPEPPHLRDYLFIFPRIYPRPVFVL
eukprot:2711335-Pyramimonas_sp.AAC.1